MYSIKLEPALNNIVLARAKGEKTSYAIFAGDEKNSSDVNAGLYKANIASVGDIASQTAVVVATATNNGFGLTIGDDGKKTFEKVVKAIAEPLATNFLDEKTEIEKLVAAGNFDENKKLSDLITLLDDVNKELVKAENKISKDEAKQKEYDAAVAKVKDLKAEIAAFRKKADEKAAKFGKDAGGNADKDKIHGVFFNAFDKEDVVDFESKVLADTAAGSAGDFGLVVKEDANADPLKQKFFGLDETRNEKTRIFGHNYGHDVQGGKGDEYNSWSRAVLYAANDLTEQALANAKLGVVPMRLNHVQLS